MPGRRICKMLPRGEITGSNIGDAPVLPELLNQIPVDQDIGSVTAPSRCCKQQLPGSGRAPEKLPATMRSMRNDILAAPCGDGGADITAEAALKPNLSGSCYA